MTNNQKKLLNILREMFQFDQADLDFGIYRIMRMKRDDVNRFIDEELPAQIKAGLEQLAKLDAAAGIIAIDKQIENTKAISFSHALKSAAIAELEEKKKLLAKGIYIADVEADVYNHLTNFFSRYYDDGDFISQRRYKEGVYAIPYEGEEVKLHWANADQYYVKTSEYFKDYVFKTDYGEVIRFKLVEAEVERDNNKANEKRFFQLHTDKAFEVINGELFIYVEYKASEGGGNAAQARYISEIVDAFGATQTQAEFQKFAAILDVTDGKSLLERQLNRYTARNTFDYFIHKNLDKFLRRELDFYIKNDVIYLDDIDEQDESKTKEYLIKAKVIRKIAGKIIAFLAQIEDFQKKLYLKKKFVVETNYCVTLDRVPETMYQEIAANEAQREEWVRLFAIDEIVGGDMFTVPYAVPLTVEFLKANPFLVLDTAFFSDEFKERLVDSIDDLDEKLDGLIIHSENSQALNLLQKRYTQQIKCVYIDPPYNADASEILYKNGYKHSSWNSMMENRLQLTIPLFHPKSMICVTIDDYEKNSLSIILEQLFGQDNIMGIVPIRNNPQGRSTVNGFAINHEYAIFCRICDQLSSVGRLEHSQKQKDRYSEVDEDGRIYLWENFRKTGTDSNHADRPKQYYPLYVDVNQKTVRIPRVEWNNQQNSWDAVDAPYDYEVVVLPLTESGEEKVWKWGIERVEANPEHIKVEINGENIQIYRKNYFNDEGSLPNTWWDKPQYAAGSHGTNLLTDIFGVNRKFHFPKSVYAEMDSIKVCGVEDSDIVLDFFAGSGTTGHAVIKLNHEDRGHRKYILVEMGEYFNTVTKPRVEKIIYSEDWKKGKPVSRRGSSHAFKYLRLESYEDSLNNIVLAGSKHDMLDEVRAREGYFLSYMLDKEASGSASLLNVEMLDKPFSYKMNITRNFESAERNIDLVETFNYLVGLTVKKSHALVTFDADFVTAEYGALSATLKPGTAYKFKAVEGTAPNGEATLVIWREMSEDIAKDNAALDAYFLSLPKARDFKRIYVNCDNNLMNLRADDENWQVVLVDEEMKKRMFEDTE